MAKKTTTEATVTTATEATKVSIKDRIFNSVPAKTVKANWKPFLSGFGTAAGLGLVTGIILKIKGSGATEQDTSYEPDTDDGCNDEVDELSTETQED